ncbi:hypothetical protein OF83DRAFT_1177099 [Amylostereum chailletii]|nr:hypothetical protein OF83DRAFT_1177099 [Amylostereum chailletii]
MAPSPVVRITSLTSSEVSEIAALASKAMAGSPSREAMLGGNLALSDEYYAAVVRATLHEGEAYAVKEDGRFVSVALWFEMKNPLFATEAQRALGFDELFKKISPEVQHWWTHTYPEAIDKWQAQIFTPEENARLTWCYMLATEETHQNRGLARSSVDTWYDKATERGQLVGLAADSDLNARKYVSMGFRERGRTVIDDPTIDGVLCISMSKD